MALVGLDVGTTAVKGVAIDEVAGRIDEPALRQAQQEKDAVRAYELVYTALGA